MLKELFNLKINSAKIDKDALTLALRSALHHLFQAGEILAQATGSSIDDLALAMLKKALAPSMNMEKSIANDPDKKEDQIGGVLDNFLISMLFDLLKKWLKRS